MPITLELKAKHFKDTNFYSDSCAIAKAFEELTGIHPRMGYSFVETSDGDYKFPHYGVDLFGKDQLEAEHHNFDETVVIRTLELVKDEEEIS